MIYNHPTREVKTNQLKPFGIAWLFPHSDLNRDPSNRLRRYQIHKYMKNFPGIITSKTFFNYEKMSWDELKWTLSDFDVIVLFNINEYDKNICDYFGNDRVIIFDHCENIFGLGLEDDIMKKASAITCCSNTLAYSTEQYSHQKFGMDKNIFVIRDPLDDSVLSSRIVSPPTGDHALIMGMGGNVKYSLSFLDNVCKIAGYTITLLTESGHDFPGYDTRVWSSHSWVEEAQSCSVCLCYHDTVRFPAKGNVKVTQPMSIGLPVVASCIDSYAEAINGSNGYIVSDNDNVTQWVECLAKLRDPWTRAMVGLKARQTALIGYSTDKIALDYLSMISMLLPETKKIRI